MLGVRTGDLQPTRGEVKRHSHLSIGRYHQHSVDVLDESMRVLDFFMHTCAPLPRQPYLLTVAEFSRTPYFLAMAALDPFGCSHYSWPKCFQWSQREWSASS